MATILPGILQALGVFVLAYPITMAVVWMVGGMHYYLRRERGQRQFSEPPPMRDAPFASILIPCHNEGENLADTMMSVMDQRYPGLIEVIAINDGSTDNTAEVLDRLALVYRRLRVIHLDSNQGKAVGLRTGALAARSDYLVCIDGDALLDQHAVHWLVWHLQSGPRVGAVTGNPRIRNRSTLLGKLQVGEFSSVIGMVKRSQRAYGRLFTVSGVISAFRRTALHDVGFWSDIVVTDDIEVTWRLQMNHWDVRYEPRALCWILMPETLRGLWRQRLRWAVGGVQTLFAHGRDLLIWRRRRMWGVMTELIVSVVWSYSVVLLTVVLGLGVVMPLPEWMEFDILSPSWTTVLIATVCMSQFAVSMLIDRRYDVATGRLYYWMIWYPFAYWLIMLSTIVIAVPKVMFATGKEPRRATWVSPDRGVR